MLIFANFKIIYGDMKNHNRRNRNGIAIVTLFIATLIVGAVVIDPHQPDGEVIFSPTRNLTHFVGSQRTT